jgi:hypothetical protein
MKIWPIISVFFIVTLVCAPVLAISASELISSYHTGSPSLINIPKRIPSVTPTATPTPQVTLTLLPTRDFSSIFDLFKNKSTIVMPTIGPRARPTLENPQHKLYTCPPDIPFGELSTCLCSCECIEGEDCSLCVNPETGMHYPLGMDSKGRTYVVKEGCPAKWADEE